MLKLIKYEIRKHILSLAVLAGLFIFIEGFTVYSILSGNRLNNAFAFSMIGGGCFAASLIVFVLGIQTYSRELGSNNSYMMFMTPYSPYRIVASKLLFTLIVALMTTVAAVVMLFANCYLLLNHSLDAILLRQLEYIITSLFEDVLKMDMRQFFLSLCATLIVLWLNVFTFICIAYFSITLSATLFSNRKGRGLLSFIIFVAFCYLLSKVTHALPALHIGRGLMAALTEPLLIYLTDAAVCIGAFLGTGALLDKRISL